MFTDIESLYNSLDFTEYDYFYHITGIGNGESIIEKGLLVEGSNIINANNLLFTTTIEITEELTPTLEDFIALIEENSYISRLRDTSEMVILAAPKDYNKELVYGCDQYIDGIYYRGIISNEFVLAYINLITQDVITNEDCEYQIDTIFKK